MSRLPPLLLVFVVWAAIFLPALGSFEIKGEEGRRILPAVAMMENGNYLVPEVGGEAYFRKPPLVNWLIAGSFKIFHARNEWTARVPSVLCILAVAIAFVTVARRNLGSLGSTMAALAWLTNLGTIEKGRFIEIEALYVSLSALAMIFWLSAWLEKRSAWRTWLIPAVFLGLGWLAKGPTHLLFFYALVIAVLWQNKQWRALLHPAHFVGILLMLAIFAAWVIPFMHVHESGKVIGKWSGQFTGRVTGEFFHFNVWILTIPRALGYFLPWLLLAPFIRLTKFTNEGNHHLARALVWSTAVPLIGISLMPGAAPRYSLPVLTPFCWLIGLSFAHDAFERPAWLKVRNGQFWVRVARVFVMVALFVGLVCFPIAAYCINHRDELKPSFLQRLVPQWKVKNIAGKINEIVPQTETLYAVDPNYQPFFFYMRSPVVYLSSLAEVPYDARYFLVRPDNEEEAKTSEQWSPRHARLGLRVKDYRSQTLVLFVIEQG